MAHTVLSPDSIRRARYVGTLLPRGKSHERVLPGTAAASTGGIFEAIASEAQRIGLRRDETARNMFHDDETGESYVGYWRDAQTASDDFHAGARIVHEIRAGRYPEASARYWRARTLTAARVLAATGRI